MWPLALVVLGAAPSRTSADQGPPTCRTCHRRIVDSFDRTAHRRTSTAAGPSTILGDFAPGHNVLRTRSPGVSFTMEQRPDGFYQSARDSVAGGTRAERIDIVVGSGRRGQTYLYWRNGVLFELPVSYLTATRQWINSPGYPDGQIDFSRIVVPRCLECHATSFSMSADRRVRRYSSTYQLGIGCRRCHGDGRQHVAYQTAHPEDTTAHDIFNPAHASRDRLIDVCALCHSGGRELKRPPFSFRPGDSLDAFLQHEPAASVVPDVHGNQIGLLRRSQCFRSSPSLSCTTCHDVHQRQRDVTAFVPHCLQCHDPTQHPRADLIGTRLTTLCIDCHMPVRKSNAIQINTARRQAGLYFRSHEIAVYPEVAAELLRPHP